MESNRLWRIDDIPILISSEGSKHYFTRDAQGHLKHFSCENGSWTLKADHIFAEKIQGFDAVIDKRGDIHILGYNESGSLFYLSSPNGQKSLTEPFYHDGGKKIGHLSACVDEENNLHVLCLSLNKQQEMWWLLYFYREKYTWKEPTVIDFGYHFLEQNGLILRDLKGGIFILHRLSETGNYCLVLRPIQGKEGTAGKTFYLPDRHRECFFPAYLITPDNTLHISWISVEDNILFLNYIQRNHVGKWDSFFSIEVPRGALTIAPLYYMEGSLVLTCQKDKELLCFISTNEGKNWKWRERILLPQQAQLTRFLSVNDFRQRKYVFASDSPPKVLYPKGSFSSLTEKVELKKEFQLLDLLTLSLLTHAGNLQASNAFLKQQLGRKEKELEKIYSWGVSMQEKMEEKLHSKKMELQQIEASFKKILEELQLRIIKEKEEMTSRNKDLTMQVQKLQQKNEELKKENLILLRSIGELREQVKALTTENEELKAKKNLFLPKLLNRFKG